MRRNECLQIYVFCRIGNTTGNFNFSSETRREVKKEAKRIGHCQAEEDFCFLS